MKKYIISLLVILSVISIYFIYENYQNKDSRVKYLAKDKIDSIIISEKNSKIIKLNKRENLPFHPVKILLAKNYIYYINSGGIYKLNLNNSKISEIKVPYKTHEIINASIYQNSIYFLDKLNLIYIYDLNTNKFKAKFNFNQYKDIEPQFISINSDKTVNILDNSQNKIFYIKNGQLKTFKQSSSLYTQFNADNNLTESIDFYSEKDSFYILEKGNTLKVISKNSSEEYPIIQKNDVYGYLKIYSNKNLKNIYFSGGYNGNILVVDKKNKNCLGSYQIILNKKRLAVYDVFIQKNKMYIIAENNLVIYDNFKENNFQKLEYNNDQDLLSDSLNFSNLKEIKMPIDNGSSLPLHASVYPGARRLYRFGIHEGIDFFENVTSQTPVIACKEGTVIRVDKNYKEMTIAEHKRILNETKRIGFTSSAIADKLRGRQVVITHQGKVMSVYSHLSKIKENIKVGDKVDQGDIVGYIGNSGTTDGVYNTNKGLHLHFELHIDDKSKELEYYLGKYLSVEETMQIYRKILE